MLADYPSGTNEGAEPDGATPPPPPRVIDHTHEVMFVQGDSADIPASITEITQVRAWAYITCFHSKTSNIC